MSRGLSVVSTVVRKTAEILRPEARRITADDLNMALLLLKFKEDVGNDPGEDVYTKAEAAKLLHPDYDEVGLKAKQGYQNEVMGYGLRLVDMSAHTRGASALAVIMMNERTYKLWKNGEASVEDVIKSYGPPFIPYTRIGVFGNLNGEFAVGWAEYQNKKGHGLEDAAVRRVGGWGEGGILTEGSQKLLTK